MEGKDIFFLICFILFFLVAISFSQPGIPTTNNLTNATSTAALTSKNLSNSKKETTYTAAKPSGLNTVAPKNSPTLSYLSRMSGPTGVSVTINGSGFTPSNNAVHFGTKILYAASSDSQTLSFTVPNILTQSCPDQTSGCYVSDEYRQNQLGTYEVYVTNARGASNKLSFTITGGTNDYQTERPSIINVEGPREIRSGDQALWTVFVSNYTPASLTTNVSWSDGVSDSQASKTITVSGGQPQSLTFSHTFQSNGYYTVTFTVTDNVSGLQSSYSFTVSVSASVPVTASQPLYLSSVFPSQGKAGTQLTLKGTGFAASGALVHFGALPPQQTTAYNYGTTIYFNVPWIATGTYPLYISNSLGQITQTFYFQVIQ